MSGQAWYCFDYVLVCDTANLTSAIFGQQNGSSQIVIESDWRHNERFLHREISAWQEWSRRLLLELTCAQDRSMNRQGCAVQGHFHQSLVLTTEVLKQAQFLRYWQQSVMIKSLSICTVKLNQQMWNGEYYWVPCIASGMKIMYSSFSATLKYQ